LVPTQEREGAREVKTALLAALMIGGLSQAHADGYRAATKFEQIKAKCELVADGMQQNGFAFGSSAFVGDMRLVALSKAQLIMPAATIIA
jgi:hypothetical protein